VNSFAIPMLLLTAGLVLAPPCAGQSGAWSPTGDLITARWSHTATLLPDGTVLVAGGSGTGSSLASAELYDPATGTWTATGSLVNARQNYTATLLPDGTVLVAGGLNDDVPRKSAELYDPASGIWTETGDLANARYAHTATLLPNGKVLVAGGSNGGGSGGAELYDPASGTWTETGSLRNKRQDHTATLLPNGKVLIVGGMHRFVFLASAELYDPANASWTETGSLATARHLHTATLLPNGKVLVAGGQGPDSNFTASAELYDPASGTWTETGSLAIARGLHTATLLPNGKVLVAGGGTYTPIASAELYDPASGTWTETGDLLTARFVHTATLLSNGKVLAAGGLDNSNFPPVPAASTELYDSETTGGLVLASAASVKRRFAINLPLTGPSGVEDRSGGPNKKYTVVMTFNENIVSVGGASSTCGAVQSVVIDSSDPHKVNVNLVNVAHGCNGSTIAVTADSITDDQGNVLDSASVPLGLLLGDVNGDRAVDSEDVHVARQFAHQRTDSTNFRADVSNDGYISSSDKTLIDQQLGTFLP
jgi:N-acetylneuraminic acid mutarotase